MTEKIICDKSDLVSIADSVRAKTGVTEQMSLGGIKSNIDNFSGSNYFVAYTYNASLQKLNSIIVFPQGATWSDFISSDFNKLAVTDTLLHPILEADGSYVESSSYTMYYVTSDGSISGKVLLSDNIIADKIYQFVNDD